MRRSRRPAADTERSQHDFHCQRAKDESHYPDQDRRALPTDHPQNRIRKKQQDVGQKEHYQKDNAGAIGLSRLLGSELRWLARIDSFY